MRPLLYLCLCLTFLTIAACNNPVPEPTPDVPATVTAQVQSHLAAIPTATPVPTYTPYPTPTTVPTATPYPTFTPRPTYTLYPTPMPRPTATPVPEVAWKTVSDDAGTYTISIPEYWTLDSVEMLYEDGKSSLTTWQAAHDGRASISIIAVHRENGWDDTSETAIKAYFDEIVANLDTVAIEEPTRFLDGWRYVVKALGGDNYCTSRDYLYWEVRYKWTFVVEAYICLGLIDTYAAEVAEAVSSFESTS